MDTIAKRDGMYGLTLFTGEATRSAEEIQREERRRAIAERQARRLVGTAGDMTADMFGGGDTPLFNERRNAPTAPASKPVMALHHDVAEWLDPNGGLRAAGLMVEVKR